MITMTIRITATINDITRKIKAVLSEEGVVLLVPGLESVVVLVRVWVGDELLLSVINDELAKQLNNSLELNYRKK